MLKRISGDTVSFHERNSSLKLKHKGKREQRLTVHHSVSLCVCVCHSVSGGSAFVEFGQHYSFIIELQTDLDAGTALATLQGLLCP